MSFRKKRARLDILTRNTHLLGTALYIRTVRFYSCSPFYTNLEIYNRKIRRGKCGIPLEKGNGSKCGNRKTNSLRDFP